MTKADLLTDAFERVRDAVYPAVNGLSVDELRFRPDGQSNSIAWLAWHLARVQDQAVAALAGDEPVWTGGGWFGVFGLPLDPRDTGRGHAPHQVETVVADARSLLDYFEDVHRRTVAWIGGLDDAALGRPVEEGPAGPEGPATVERILVGVVVDDLQHAGQAAYVRGLVQRR